MKNIFGYFVGVLLFLVFFPALMYAVAVNFVVSVDSLIVSTVGAIFVLIGAGEGNRTLVFSLGS